MSADKKQIWIIDDNEAIAKIVKIYLRDEYGVSWLENPAEAMEILEKAEFPDLILSDIRMPMMRGDEFLNKIKENDNYRSIPVIMLSGEDSTSEKERLLACGAIDYIVKPFSPAELKMRIKSIIG